MLNHLLDIFGDLRVICEKLLVPMPKASDIGSLSLLAEKNARAYPNKIAIVSDEETETWIGRQQTEQSSMYSCESMEISIKSSIDSPQ